jgi:hypothetical protein
MVGSSKVPRRLGSPCRWRRLLRPPHRRAIRTETAAGVFSPRRSTTAPSARRRGTPRAYAIGRVTRTGGRTLRRVRLPMNVERADNLAPGSEGGPMYCSECSVGPPDSHRYCVACGSRLPLELPRTDYRRLRRCSSASRLSDRSSGAGPAGGPLPARHRFLVGRRYRASPRGPRATRNLAGRPAGVRDEPVERGGGSPRPIPALRSAAGHLSPGPRVDVAACRGTGGPVASTFEDDSRFAWSPCAHDGSFLRFLCCRGSIGSIVFRGRACSMVGMRARTFPQFCEEVVRRQSESGGRGMSFDDVVSEVRAEGVTPDAVFHLAKLGIATAIPDPNRKE